MGWPPVACGSRGEMLAAARLLHFGAEGEARSGRSRDAGGRQPPRLMPKGSGDPPCVLRLSSAATTAASSAPNSRPGGLALPATSRSVVISPAAQIRAPRASSRGVRPRTSTGRTRAAAAKIPAAARTEPSISGVSDIGDRGARGPLPVGRAGRPPARAAACGERAPPTPRSRGSRSAQQGAAGGSPGEAGERRVDRAETDQAEDRRRPGQGDRVGIDRRREQRSAEHGDQGRDARFAGADQHPEQNERELQRVGGTRAAEGEDTGDQGGERYRCGRSGRDQGREPERRDPCPGQDAGDPRERRRRSAGVLARRGPRSPAAGRRPAR